MIGIRMATLGAVVLLLSGCGPRGAAVVPLPPADPSAPQTWIDAPLDRMHLPLAAYEVVFHATGDPGIAAVELRVDQQVLPLPVQPEMGGKLVTLRYAWEPAAAGEHLLQARAQNTSGEWGEFAEARVTIGDPTPSETPGTPTPTPTVTPTPSGPAFLPSVSAPSFHFGACSPTSVDVRVQVTGVEADSVVLMLHLVEQAGTGRTDWFAYNAMNPLRDGGYGITVAASAIPGYTQFTSAWLAYQFVATRNNAVVARSPVFSDVTLSACGRLPILLPEIPPILIITPTHPPIVK